MGVRYKPTKGWDYEDDHDYDSNIDYAALNQQYWYGKYYDKEKIDALFPEEKPAASLKPLLVGSVVLGGLYGVALLANNAYINYEEKKRAKEIEKRREAKKKEKPSQ